MAELRLDRPPHGAHISQQTKEAQTFAETMELQGADAPGDWRNLHQMTTRDLTLPKPIPCAWSCQDGLPRKVWIEAKEEGKGAAECMTFEPSPGEKKTVAHSLKIGTTYLMRACWRNQAGTLEHSRINRITTEDRPPRWIRIDGVSNVRDMGGWECANNARIRQGLVYRGGELQGHMTATPEGLSFMRKNLRIRCVLDLRTQEEVRKAGGGKVLPPPVRWVNIPLDPYGNIGTDRQMKQYAEAFRVMLEPENLPLYVHCWGGADRTGTLIFLMEAALGMEEDLLLKDYEITSLSIWGMRSRNSRQFQELERLLRDMTGKETYEAQAIEYFQKAGITTEELQALKHRFLEQHTRKRTQ